MNIRFWPLLHIFMGLFFIVIGIMAATLRRFGAVDLSAGWAFGFATLLVLYGIFRIWRGIKDLRTDSE